MRKISDEELRRLVLGKKVDFRETRLLRQEENLKSERPAEDEERDHPIIAQGKAILELATALGGNLLIQNDALANIVTDQIATIQSIQATTPVRRAWKLQVNRNAEGFAESLDVIPVDDEKE